MLRANGFENSARVGEFAGFFLGIDFLPVDAHLKNSAPGGDKSQGTNILFEPQKLFRQTDGLRLVVSNTAIFNSNFQCHTLTA